MDRVRRALHGYARGAVYFTLVLWLVALGIVLIARSCPGAIAIAVSLGLVSPSRSVSYWGPRVAS